MITIYAIFACFQLNAQSDQCKMQQSYPMFEGAAYCESYVREHNLPQPTFRCMSKQISVWEPVR